MSVIKQRLKNLLFHNLISSFVYRLIIVVYGGYIVISHDNFVAAPYYAILMLGYIVAYILLIEAKWKYLRQLLDAVVILAVLYDKTPLDNMCFVYALFPLISSIAHTGFHSKYWPVLLLSYLMLFIFDIQMAIDNLFVPLLIWLVGIQAWRNNKMNNFSSTITAHVDNYFAECVGTKRPHEIYINIINEINNFLDSDYLLNIYSYRLKNNVLWLVNSSEFIWERKLFVDSLLLEELIERKSLYDVDNHMLYFYVEQRDVKYIYCCKINPSVDRISIRKKFVVHYVLEVAFGKMSKILVSEHRISETRRKAFEKTRGHVDYVTRALKAMHFIRNKLSPIKTVITFYNDIENIDEKKANLMKDVVKKEVGQANKDLKEIVNMANYLLDKQNDPYWGLDIENKSLQFLFVVLSEIVELHLGGVVDVSDSISRGEQEKEVRVSVTQLKLLFTDLVSNIEKYGYDNYSISMEIDDTGLIIAFMNDIDSKSESNCIKLVRDINNNDKEGFVARNTHGVYNIKAAASIMNVDLCAELTGEKKNKRIVLKTRFKLYDRNDNNGKGQDSCN